MFYNHMIFCKSNEMLKKYDAYCMMEKTQLQK